MSEECNNTALQWATLAGVILLAMERIVQIVLDRIKKSKCSSCMEYETYTPEQKRVDVDEKHTSNKE